ncbi:hypothetical protein MSG28_013665 [Choristoneura fumiferana]|uniref:Uncharacterized protein n=1 Tax=Choristoneura fumiferana TaxID=7141 RepID=A0ACC0K8E5_CHOFU|nr:hypothetical protein MSG28_013665 [Choristoneura fumiferana]
MSTLSTLGSLAGVEGPTGPPGRRGQRGDKGETGLKVFSYTLIMSTLDAITGAQKYLETSAVQQLDEFKKAFRKTPPRMVTMASLRAELRKFEDSVWSIMKVISQQIVLMSNSFDVIEMRHRSDFLLFEGIPETDGYEEDAVVSVCRSMMHVPDVDADSFLLSRRLGAPLQSRTRPILVRFKDPELRDIVWEKRAALKGSSVVVSEFLTRRRLEVFNRARKNFGEHNVWTYKGIIFVKVPNGETHYIVTDDQLNKLITQHLGGSASVKEIFVTWNPELVPQMELTSPSAEESVTLSEEVVSDTTTSRVEVVPLNTKLPSEVKTELQSVNTASPVGYIPLDSKVAPPYVVSVSTVPEVASHEGSVTPALPTMMAPLAQYVPPSTNVQVPTQINTPSVNAALPAQSIPPSINVVAPGQYIPLSAKGVPVPHAAFSKSNAQIASQVEYVPAPPSVRVAMPVKSIPPSANLELSVESVPANAKVTLPVESIPPSANRALNGESIPATARVALPVVSLPPSVKMALPVEAIPPSAKMALPVESVPSNARVALPVDSIPPSAKMSEPMVAIPPSARLALPEGSIPPNARVALPAEPIPPSAEMSVPVVAISPNGRVALPVESIPPSAKMVLPVESIPPSARVEFPIESLPPSAKTSASVVALPPSTELELPVESVPPSAKMALPLESIPTSARVALPFDSIPSNVKEEIYAATVFPSATLSPNIGSVPSSPNVGSYAYFPPPPIASLDGSASLRKSVNSQATSTATLEEELTSSVSPISDADEGVLWPSRVGIRDINPMTDEQLDSLYFALTRRIAESPEGKGPNFESLYYKPGWLLIVCKNQHAKSWLDKIIPSLKPWPGSKLSLISESDVLNPKIGVVFIPIPEAKDIGHTLCLLRAQNKGLQTDIWKVLSKRDEKDGVTLTLSLDELSVEALKKTDLKASLAFRKVKKVKGAFEVRLDAMATQDHQGFLALMEL